MPMAASSNTTKPKSAPTDPLAPRVPLSVRVDMTKLRSMDMSELQNFRDVAHTIASVLYGFMSQPRFNTEDHNRTQGGEILEALVEWVQAYEQAAFNVAEAAKPVTTREAIQRGWTLIGFNADLGDALTDFAVLASEICRDVEATRWNEAHGHQRGAA